MPPPSSLRIHSGFRRCVHTLTDDPHTHERLRALLRETAQSVAVVTARLPATPTPSASAASTPAPAYHGATLSSFTSIALDPFPLIAFSLRVPSRMAFALNAHVASSQPSWFSSSCPDHRPMAHLVVNILSAAQPDLAERFARPDRFPRPFEDPRGWSLSEDGLPVLSGALGALSCALVGHSLPLARLCGSHPSGRGGNASERAEGESERGEEVQQASGGSDLASELFIARVLRVERVPAEVDEKRDDARLYKLPLVYHRRRYTTVEDSDHAIS